jgi:hypothetical protein
VKGDDFLVAAEVVERELKDDADAHLTVPDVRSLIADGRVDVGKQALDSVYFDTDHRDLLAFGVTLLTAGDLIAEIADDGVAPGPGTVTLSQWRELESGLGPAGTEELLAAVDAQLIEAGATRSPLTANNDRVGKSTSSHPERRLVPGPSFGGVSGSSHPWHVAIDVPDWWPGS